MDEGTENQEGQGAADQDDRDQHARDERMKEIEENPPQDLEDWPDDANKYKTIGGADSYKCYE